MEYFKDVAAETKILNGLSNLEKLFPDLGVLNERACNELTSKGPIEAVPLFAEMYRSFAVAHVNPGECFSPGGGNSGRGPNTRA